MPALRRCAHKRLEMRARLRVQGIEQQRRAGDDALHVRILAVEYPQRIAPEPALAVLIERGFVRAEVGRELLAIRGARSGRSQRIDQQLRAGQPETPQQACGQQDDFRIHIRPLEPERLRIDLMKLTVASGLRPFAPEHRSHAPDPQAPLAQHAVRDDRTHDASGRLRAQRDVVLALIDEAEHLLLDDVGKVADRAFEQLRLLDDGDPKFLIAVAGENFACDALQVLPGCDLRGQHIVHAAQGLDDLAQEFSPISRLAARCASGRASPSPAAAHVGIAPQDAVGAGLEARHVAGEELRPDRHRAIVDLQLHAAGETQVHAHGRSTCDGLHAVGAAFARECPPALGIVHVHPGVCGKAQAKPCAARPCRGIWLRRWRGLRSRCRGGRRSK